MPDAKAPARTTAAKKKPLAKSNDEGKPTDAHAKSERVRKVTESEPTPGPSYIGNTPDDTPDEHYTLSGVIAGKPVPEHHRSVG